MIDEKKIQEAAELIPERLGWTNDGCAEANDIKGAFIDGAKWALEQSKWTRPQDYLPPDSGKYNVEQIQCLAIRNSGIEMLYWNPTHNCWDNADGDDWECDPFDVEWYMRMDLLPEPPKQ